MGLAAILAGLISSERLAAQVATPAPVPVAAPAEDPVAPVTQVYGGVMGSRDLALRLNYNTDRYGQDNGQFGVGLQAHRPFDRGVWLFSGQYNMDFGETEQMGLNVGGGIRVLRPDIFGTGHTRIFGATLWYDGRQTEIHSYFNEMGFHLESLGDLWDFRVSGNFPIGLQTQAGKAVPLWNADGTPTLGFAGENLTQVTRVPIDEAISVVDFEAARRISQYDAWIFAGGYGMDASGDNCFGAKGGLRGWVGNDALLQLAVTNDDFFKTTVSFAVVWYPGRSGLFSPRSRSIEDRLRDPVLRNDYIATRRLHERGDIPLHDESGDAINIVHVYSEATAPGNGSYENPYTSLDSVYGGSQEGDVILAWSGSQHDGEAIVLRDRQRLLGEGNDVEHKVMTEEFGMVTLPETRAGAASGPIPVFANAPSTVVNPGDPEGGAAVTLGAAETVIDVAAKDFDATKYNEATGHAYNEVSNLKITGGPMAVKSNGLTIDTTTGDIVSRGVGIGLADINNLDVEDTDYHGVALTPITLTFDNKGSQTKQVRFKPTIATGVPVGGKTTFSGVGASGVGDDIYLDARTGEPSTTTVEEAITIANVESTDSNGWGINIIGNQKSATIAQYAYTAGTNSKGGIQFTSSPGGATVSSTTITGDTGTAGVGVRLAAAVTDTFAGKFTFNDVAITDMGGAGLEVVGGATDVDFTGLITQTKNAAAAVYVHNATDPVTLQTLAHTGTLNFNEMTSGAGVVYATVGTGTVFENANGVYNFNSLVKMEDSPTALNLTTGIAIRNDDPNAGGLFTFSNASIKNATQAGLRIDGGQSTVNFTGLITDDSATAGYAVDIKGGHNGSVTFNEAAADQGTIVASTGHGLLFTNADGTYRFNNLVSVSADADAGISITQDGAEGSDGAFTFSNALLTDLNGVAFNLNGGTAKVDFTGKITQTSNPQAAVTIGGGHKEGTESGQNTGVVTFSEKTLGQGVVFATTGTGLQFENADGTYRFNNLVAVSGGAGTGATAGISITEDGNGEGSDGNFTFSDVTLTDINGVAFNLYGGTADVNFTGLITQTKNAQAVVTIGGGHAAGTEATQGDGIVNFNEKTANAGIITATMGTGIRFADADGTYNFNHKVSIGGNATAGINIGKELTETSNGTFKFSNIETTSINGTDLTIDGGSSKVTLTGKFTHDFAGAPVVNVTGGHNGTLTMSEKTTDAGIITATAGTGLQFNQANGVYNFNHLVDLQDVSTGVQIVSSEGTFTFAKTEIDDATDAALRVNGGTANVAFTGLITQDLAGDGLAVDILGDHNGTVTLNEKKTDEGIIIASQGDGLRFTNADGTYNFNKKVTLSGDAHIDVQTSDGAITFSNATVTDNTSGVVGLNINGGAADVNFTGLLTQTTANTAAVLNVEGGHTGTLTMTEKKSGEGIIVASNGLGLAFNTANGTYNLNSKMTLSGTAGIDIVNSQGTITMSNASSTITKSGLATGDAFHVNGGNATVVYAGDITTTAGVRPVLIENVTGGAVTLSGKVNSSGSGLGIRVANNVGTGVFRFNGDVALSTGANTGVELSSNTGATTRFAKLTINTTSGTGLDASGGGILEVTNSASSIAMTAADLGTDAALRLNGIEIGSGGATFASVSANGNSQATNGIVLNNLTGSGTLTINGGTIENTTGAAPAAGISITNAAHVSLNNMLVKDAAGGSNGIYLKHDNTNSFNVTVANCTVNGTTGQGIYLDANGSGSMRLTLNNNTVTQASATQAVDLAVGSGAGNTYITLDGNSISSTASGANREALRLNVDGGTCNFKADGNTFTSKDTTSTFNIGVATGTLNATIQNNTLSNTQDVDGRALVLAATSGAANVKLSLLDNSAGTQLPSGNRPFLLRTTAGASYGVVLLTTPDPAHTPPAQGDSLKTADVNMRNGGTYDNNTGVSTYVITFDPNIGSFTNLTAGSVPTP
jgi:hypothetical protein